MHFRTAAIINRKIGLLCLIMVCVLTIGLGTVSAQSTTATVTGHVTNGTAASTVPADLVITLVISPPNAQSQQLKADFHPDGSFIFNDVPIIADADYVAATIYRDRVFNSQFVKGAAGTSTFDLPITIYEPTEDPSVITVIGTIIQVSQGDSALEFRQVIRFRNTSDRIFTSSQDLGGGRFASVVIPLPPGAQVISFDNPNRYVVAQDKFTIIDSAPVFPGDDNQALIVYILPYDGSPALTEQVFNYPFDGQARLLLWPQTMGLKSGQLPPLDKETLGDREYQTYGAPLKLKPGDVLSYEISGGNGVAATPIPASSAPSGSNNAIFVLVLVIIAAVAGVAILLALRMRKTAAPTPEQLIDALTRQLENLDRQHASGELNHDIWHRQRAPLEARLNQLRGEDSDE